MAETKNILKAFDVRLYPTIKQRHQINQTLGNCRWYYNHLIWETRNYYKEHGTTKGLEHKTEKELKKDPELIWLKLGSSRALQQENRHYKEAINRAFRKDVSKERAKRIASTKNDKEKAKAYSYGFPSFKLKQNQCSYTEPQVGAQIEVKENSIRLLRLGYIKFKNYRNIPIKDIHKVTVKRTTTGKYFAAILCAVDILEKEKVAKTVGIDLGLKSFLIDSNNTLIENPKFFRTSEQRIKQHCRWLSRKKKGSNNWVKQKLRLARLYEKVRNKRKDFLQKLSTKVINESQVIALEDLSVKNMVKNRKLSKSISDVAWSEFVSMLTYKSDWYARTIVKIDKFFPSSKMCSGCGHVKKELLLSTRIYNCEECGLVMDRDLNAARNILVEGLRILNTEEYSGINACEDGGLPPPEKQEGRS